MAPRGSGQSDRALRMIEREYAAGFRGYVRLAAALSGRPDDAPDLVQDAFVRAVRARKTYRGDGPIGAWLWRIVARTALTATGEGRGADDIGRAEIGVEPGADVDDLRRVVARLPQRQRLILFLRFYGDMDYRTIAEVASVEVGTVGPTLAAAIASLRRTMSEVPQ